VAMKSRHLAALPENFVIVGRSRVDSFAPKCRSVHKHWYSVTNAVASPQLLSNSVYLDAVTPLLHLLTYAGYVGDAGIS